MKIIKYEKYGKDKYKIYFDNDEVLTLYDEVILKNDLLFKKEIGIEIYNKLINDNKYFDVYNMCVKYIMVRLRSIKEMREYLLKKKIESDLIEVTINKLIENNYLDEDKFANSFIHDKLLFSSMGEYKIISELRRYGIDNEIIYKYIDEIDKNIFIEKIDKYIDKVIKSSKKSGSILKNKIYNYLVNLGYDKSMVIEELNKCDF